MDSFRPLLPLTLVPCVRFFVGGAWSAAMSSCWAAGLLLYVMDYRLIRVRDLLHDVAEHAYN